MCIMDFYIDKEIITNTLSNYLDLILCKSIFSPFNLFFLSRLLSQCSKININAKDQDGLSPLHISVDNNAINITRLLLSLQRSTELTHTVVKISTNNATNSSINTITNSTTNSAINSEINNMINSKSNTGDAINTTVTANSLNNNIIDVNIQSNDLSTPLHLAIENKNIEMIKELLVIKDINLELKNENGYTSLLLAIRSNDENIINIVRNHYNSSR